MLTTAICVAAGTWLQQSKETTSYSKDFTLSNIDAFMDAEISGSETDGEKGDGSLSDWWNRKDWICVEVECVTLVGKYKSTVSQKVANGTGTEAHSWNCPGCGDNGYVV